MTSDRWGKAAVVKAVAAILMVSALFGGAGVASAGPRPAPSGLPSVLCRERIFPGRAKPTTPGSYAYKPGSCTLEAFDRNEGYEASSHLLAIEWQSWSAGSAAGRGFVPIEQENVETGERRRGRQPVKITLGRPRTRCGRRVFSTAHVYWLHAGLINYGYRLHQEPVLGHGCPAAAKP